MRLYSRVNLKKFPRLSKMLVKDSGISHNMKMMYLTLHIILTSFLLYSALVHAGDVYVRGHVRKDGTYVSPHYRSAPDSSFYNNWSTYGNVNPYTGEVGTKRYPSTLPNIPSSPPRTNNYQTYPLPNTNVPPTYQYQPNTTNNLLEDMNKQSRIQTSMRLKALGYDFDSDKYSLLQLMDFESRIEAANRLRRLGYNANWQSYSLLQLMDFESRIEAANRLRRLGYNANWQSYSLLQLMNMETQANLNSR